MEIIYYNNEKIEYEIIQKRIKNMYIQIKDGKVYVKVPKKVSIKKAKEFAELKASWIYKTIKKESLKKPEIQIDKNILLEKAKIIYPEIMNELVEKTKLIPKSYRIRDIKYAWGSCSTKKNITLSLKLAGKERPLIEYVILHELCHLKYMNHSKDFWNLVETYMPDYKERRKKLNFEKYKN